ncbi:ShlB/FhaC/HecB family hemolysin secretion/activation protein [Helicobacter sp. 11S02596-1]|uniref:ShlB/FhaC/HecB family hemolysin secretion/activation protein n=1 Tax=Helicobacter sp. 11S02596-1 TaxID=1476194 RepID=UPI000BA7D6A8|nr:ShlB/FhaC/HecB family hemolysin secretion/activation protein [Helicobacter sp. 11S02596-1]PAF44752.1 hypothetical protein BJI48_01830 [Helicobacter sp. 11S02596-1]
MITSEANTDSTSGSGLAICLQKTNRVKIIALIMAFFWYLPLAGKEIAITPAPNPITPEKNCFDIDEILLVPNVSSLVAGVKKTFLFLSPILATYSHQCLDKEKITHLLNALKLASLKKGYITTEFGITPQDLRSKQLIITLQTTIVGAIEVQGKQAGWLWGKDYAINIGDILSIKPIERGLYNFKRLKTNQPVVEILPMPASLPDKPQESKISIENPQPALPIYASISADNAGSLSTGIYQTSLQFGLENLLSLAESFHTYAVFTPDMSQAHSIYVSSDFSIPWRRFLLSVSGSYAHYAQKLSIGQKTFSYNGYGANLDIKGSVLVYLDNLNSLNFNFGLGKRWAQNYLENIALIVQNRNLTNIYANINYSRYIKNASISVSIGVKQGVKWLGSMKNFPNNNVKSAPNFFYTLPTIDVYTSVPLRLWDQNFAYSGFVKTQISRTHLYASEKFGLGGIYSVRGFDSSVLSGEIGVLNRNDWTYYLPSVFKLTFVPSLGLDMGYTSGIDRSRNDGLEDSGFIIGSAAGVKIYWSKYFNAQIWGYAPLYNPHNLKGRYFYASVGANWE